MKKRLSFTIVAVTVAAACTQSNASSPAETQRGAAEDQNKPPFAGAASGRCKDLPSAADLKKWLREAPGIEGEAGGLFSGKMEWAAVVDRQGEICATAVATDDPASAWPGSQAIAKAKAYTANAYSTDGNPLSTARLYTLTQPGHSLWGVAQPNAFNTDCLVTPGDMNKTNGKVCGGQIAFGGGVPLYTGKTRVGGLGISGDTACADHEIAKRIRHLASLDPEKGEFADDITYVKADGPSPFAHPICENTWRNGTKIGDEQPAHE
ncbi:MAG TPA: heme-binding protein [Vicinamibacterales bacterium]|nr:heme-binding protein [Vicinamibacterales bacterium]